MLTCLEVGSHGQLRRWLQQRQWTNAVWRCLQVLLDRSMSRAQLAVKRMQWTNLKLCLAVGVRTWPAPYCMAHALCPSGKTVVHLLLRKHTADDAEQLNMTSSIVTSAACICIMLVSLTTVQLQYATKLSWGSQEFVML